MQTLGVVSINFLKCSDNALVHGLIANVFYYVVAYK